MREGEPMDHEGQSCPPPSNHYLMNTKPNETHLTAALVGEISRRRFLRRTAVATSVAALASATPGAFAARDGNRDAAILNFALNLEYLEAEFYTYAFTGAGIQAQGIAVTGSGTPGNVVIKASPQVPFSSAVIQQYAREIAEDERNHVTALRATLTSLGVTPVARPQIDLLNSFNTLANAAGIATTFDPFANDLNFLLGAFIFEDVGVTAYKGASPLVANSATLEAAAGFLAAEAYHAAIVRTTLYAMAAGGMPTITATVQKISDLRDTLDGAGDMDQGIVDANSNANIVPLDGNGLPYSRSTRQVLNIVYGAVNATSGLFFPNAMNGPINA